MKIQGISTADTALISLLILHHDHFGAYLKREITLIELQKRLSKAYKDIPSEFSLTQADFTKMLWALFIARASTLSKVSQQRRIYQPYLNFVQLDCTSLQWIETLHEQIHSRESSIKPITKVKISSGKLEQFNVPEFWSLDDAIFKQQLQHLIEDKQFPFDFSSLAEFSCGHGHTPEGNPVNLLEHTQDVICGVFGGFGLNTSITVQNMSSTQIKKVLRIAALFHDSGKTEGRDGHIKRSAANAETSLKQAKKLWDVTDDEIAIIKHIILSNDLFGKYFQRHSQMSFEDLQTALGKAYTAFQKDIKDLKISEGDFRKLLFTLWIADASTLSIVNKKKADLYKPLTKMLDSMDYMKLAEVQNIKDTLAKNA